MSDKLKKISNFFLSFFTGTGNASYGHNWDIDKVSDFFFLFLNFLLYKQSFNAISWFKAWLSFLAETTHPQWTMSAPLP